METDPITPDNSSLKVHTARIVQLWEGIEPASLRQNAFCMIISGDKERTKAGAEVTRAE